MDYAVSSPSPLAHYQFKIEETKKDIEIATKSLQDITYKTVRNRLSASGENYERGLQSLWVLLNEVVLRRVTAYRDYLEKKNKSTVPLEPLLKSYSSQLNTSYQIIERLRSDFIASQVNGSLPWEIYLWVGDILSAVKFERTPDPFNIVFQSSSSFANHTFEEQILRPLDPIRDLASLPLIPGTLDAPPPPSQYEPLTKGHVIMYISGESRSIMFWPALVHELFHITQKEANWMSDFKKYCVEHSAPNVELNDDQFRNDTWIEELMMDSLAMHYFGPMFALSLINYLNVQPYPSGDYPSMETRLYLSQRKLESWRLSFAKTNKGKYEIMQRCVAKMQPQVDAFIEQSMPNRKTQKNLDALFGLIQGWLKASEARNFESVLDDYSLSCDNFNPELSYEEISKYIFEKYVPPAIHPNILLNVVLAEYEKYDFSKHYNVVVDSIKNWKVFQSWKKITKNAS
jgi:hypothetical protein